MGKEHKEMLSVWYPDPPDRPKMWEAPTQTRSVRTFNPSIRYSPARRIKEILPESWQTNQVHWVDGLCILNYSVILIIKKNIYSICQNY